MIVNYLSILLEFLCVYYITRMLSGTPLIPKKDDIIALLIILLCIGEIPAKYPFLAWLCGQLLYFCYVAFAYNNSHFLHRILLFSITLIYIAIIQVFCAAFISITPIDEKGACIDIIGNFLTVILSLLLLCIPTVKNFYHKIIHSALPYQLVLLNSYIIFFVIVLLFKINSSYIYRNIFIAVFVALFLVAANSCILYYDQKLYAREQSLIAYQKNLPIYEALIGEIRSSQHEYSNRLQSLQFLSESCKTYDELADALHKYTEAYSKPLHSYPLLQINMPLLSASLYNLSSRAEKKEITVRYDVVSENIHSNAPEEQLSDFCCILLQNAIEACSSGDSIYIHMSSSNEYFSFEIRNPSKEFYSQKQIAQFFKKNYSTKQTLKKEDGIPHGQGLCYLLNQIMKYNGKISADCISFNDEFWMIFKLVI